MSSTPASKANGTKPAKSKPSLRVSLKLSPKSLCKFPSADRSIKAASAPSNLKPLPSSLKGGLPRSQASQSTSNSDAGRKATPSSATSDADVKAESAEGTPAAQPSSSSTSGVKNEAASGVDSDAASKRKAPGTKPSSKRTSTVAQLGAADNGTPKPRGKPGPKKRKLEAAPNGELADEGSRPWTTPMPATTHKLGPKANQGAINAGLRALDRSGNPCRRWNKKALAVKSFTGVTWTLPSWGALKRADSSGGNGAGAGGGGSSGVGSEREAEADGSGAGSGVASESGKGMVPALEMERGPSEVATPA